MSLVELRSPLLSIAPRVWIEDDEVLCARTSRVWQALSLGSYSREVRFDRKRQQITLRTRFAFLAHSERLIPYARLARIEYRYGSLGTGFVWGGWSALSLRGRPIAHASDSVEWFTIELVLQNPHERVEALFFSGEGAKLTGAWGVLMGDSVVDFAGDQERESRDVFELIERFTGVGPSGRIAGAKRGDGRACSVCGYPLGAGDARCSYCGVLANRREEPPR